MTFFKKYFVNSKESFEFLPITHDLRYAVRDAGAKQALLTVQVAQSGIAVLRFDKDEDEQEALKSQPKALLNRQVSLIVEQGELQIGKHEEIYLIELEEKPARREFVVQVLGSEDKVKEADKPKAAPARR